MVYKNLPKKLTGKQTMNERIPKHVLSLEVTPYWTIVYYLLVVFSELLTIVRTSEQFLSAISPELEESDTDHVVYSAVGSISSAILYRSSSLFCAT